MTDPVFSRTKLTYRDYARMREGERYELLDGDLQLTPTPTPRHQLIAGSIGYALIGHVQSHGLGLVLKAPVDVLLSDTTVLQPDILFISRERLGIIKAKCIEGAPDLVVEVLSPATRERDTVTKRSLYGRFGVRELWLADPDNETIELCVHTGSDLTTRHVFRRGMTLTSEVLEGFELDVAHVFDQPLGA